MQRRTISALSMLLVTALACALWPGQSLAQAPGQGQPQAQPPARGGQGPGGAQGPGAGAPGRGGAGQARGGAGMVYRGDPALPKKHVLVLAFTEGFHHESTSDGAAMIWNLGKESGLFDVEIKTDAKWIVKGSPTTPRTLSWFDAIVAVNTTGVWKLDEQQRKDFIAAIHDDGKGFVGIHAALDSHRNGAWPEYTEMIGGEFVAHPWFTFWGPIIIEDPDFPAMKHFQGRRMMMYDEWYVPKAETWSRSKVNVLMRLDASKLPPPGPQEPYASLSGMGAMMAGAGNQMANMQKAGIREDGDYAMAWSKMYGKGRVFYSSIGHPRQTFDNPDVRKHFLEAIKWVLGLVEGSTASHPMVNP